MESDPRVSFIVNAAAALVGITCDTALVRIVPHYTPRPPSSNQQTPANATAISAFLDDPATVVLYAHATSQTMQFQTTRPTGGATVLIKNARGRLARGDLPMRLTIATISAAESMHTILQHVVQPALAAHPNAAQALATLQSLLSPDTSTSLEHIHRTAVQASVDVTLPPAARKQAELLSDALAPLVAPWPSDPEALASLLPQLATALDMAWQLGQLPPSTMHRTICDVGRRVCSAAAALCSPPVRLGLASQLVTAWQHHVEELDGQWRLLGTWEGSRDEVLARVAVRLATLLCSEETVAELRALLSGEQAASAGLADVVAVYDGAPLLEVISIRMLVAAWHMSSSGHALCRSLLGARDSSGGCAVGAPGAHGSRSPA